jgi:hypothetical protein
VVNSVFTPMMLRSPAWRADPHTCSGAVASTTWPFLRLEYLYATRMTMIELAKASSARRCVDRGGVNANHIPGIRVLRRCRL